MEILKPTKTGSLKRNETTLEILLYEEESLICRIITNNVYRSCHWFKYFDDELKDVFAIPSLRGVSPYDMTKEMLNMSLISAEKINKDRAAVLIGMVCDTILYERFK